MAKLTKEEKKALKAKKKAEGKTFIQEFKSFISRGNIVDMAVGVIMGSAFGAIVTAFTNILLSICTWTVPGGLKGLVTILPAVNPAQAGYNPNIVAGDASLGQKFSTDSLHALAEALAVHDHGLEVVTANPALIESAKTTILGKYSLHGEQYIYKMSSIIDWGTFINAIISFLVIALTLFVIVKIFNTLQAKRVAFAETVKAKKEALEAAKAAEEKKEETVEETEEETK